MSIKDFTWDNPTKVIIKEGGSPDIAKYISEAGIKSVLLLYGQASVKKIGLYDEVMKALKEKEITVHELPGVRANPEITKVIEGVELCRKHKLEAVLPLGGGSVFDSAKGIAVGAAFPNDVPANSIWECYTWKRPIEKALPIYGVLTISATGSEANGGTVVQKDDEDKKLFFNSPLTFPKVSIIDPAVQKHLPWYQQVNGFVDALVHIFELITNIQDPSEIETTFDISLGLMKSIIKCGDRLKADPNDYNARANFAWAATCALNGLSGIATKGGDWGIHMQEHAMSAIKPEVSHGAGLGVVLPAYAKISAERGMKHVVYDRLAQELYGKKGWQGLIEGWKDMLKRWGHPTTLKELFGTVDAALIDKLVVTCKHNPLSGSFEGGIMPDDFIKACYSAM